MTADSRTPAMLTSAFSTSLGATFSPRTANLPRVASDLDTIRANRGAVTVTWVGHATLLIQLDGVNILTDPHWSDRASPVSFAGPRRVSAPGMRFEDLLHPGDEYLVGLSNVSRAGHHRAFVARS